MPDYQIPSDLAVLLLRNLHFQRAGAPVAAQAIIDEEADIVWWVLAARNAIQISETNIWKLWPVARIPMVPYCNEEHIVNIRMNNIPVFTGCSDDKIYAISWISQILNLAQSKQLSFNATINL